MNLVFPCTPQDKAMAQALGYTVAPCEGGWQWTFTDFGKVVGGIGPGWHETPDDGNEAVATEDEAWQEVMFLIAEQVELECDVAPTAWIKLSARQRADLANQAYNPPD